jgi:hypothetical protein
MNLKFQEICMSACQIRVIFVLNDKFLCLKDKTELYLYLNDKFVCSNE